MYHDVAYRNALIVVQLSYRARYSINCHMWERKMASTKQKTSKTKDTTVLPSPRCELLASPARNAHWNAWLIYKTGNQPTINSHQLSSTFHMKRHRAVNKMQACFVKKLKQMTVNDFLMWFGDSVIRLVASWLHLHLSVLPLVVLSCFQLISLRLQRNFCVKRRDVVTSWRLWAVKFPSTKDALQIYWCTTPAGTSTQTYTKRKNDFAMPCRPTYVYICIYTSLYFSVLNHALRRGPWSFQPPHTSASSPGSPAVLTILPSLHATRPETVTVPCLDLSQVQQVTAPAGCPESTRNPWKMTIWIYGIWKKMILKKKRRKDLQFKRTVFENVEKLWHAMPWLNLSPQLF